MMKKNNILLLLLFVMIGTVVSAQKKLDRSIIPEASHSTKLNFGEYKMFKLDNGLKVIVVEDHRHPMISYSVSLKYDPFSQGNKVGYLSTTGALLRDGTTSLNKKELDEHIDFFGGAVSASSKGVSCSGLKEYQDSLLDLMTGVLFHPSFPEENFKRLQRDKVKRIASDMRQESNMRSHVLSSLLFGKKSTFGQLVTSETVKNTKLQDCKDYYHNYFKPNIAYLSIVGDITLKEAKEVAEKRFGNWKRGNIPDRKLILPKIKQKPIYAIAEHAGAKQASISVAWIMDDLKPNTQDALVASVMNNILGCNGFMGRLLQNLREKHAWCYSFFSQISAARKISSFVTSGKVIAAATDSAFEQIQYEMKRLQTEKVKEEDLQNIKKFMAGEYRRTVGNSGTLIAWAENLDKYGVSLKYDKSYLKRLYAVTADEVMAAAKKYLRPEKAVYLAVGDISVIRPLMEKFAKGQKVNQYDYWGKVVKDKTASLVLNNACRKAPVGVTANSVIASYVKAIGGVDKLKAIKTLYVHSQASAKGMTIGLNSYNKAPNEYCLSINLGSISVSRQFYNGKDAMVVSRGSAKVIGGKALLLMKEKSVIFPETNYMANGYTLKLDGIESVKGKDAYKVEIISKNSNVVVSDFDVTTGLKVKDLTSSAKGPAVTFYENYREFGGVKFPTVTKQGREGDVKLSTIEITDVQVNQHIDDSLFEK